MRNATLRGLGLLIACNCGLTAAAPSTGKADAATYQKSVAPLLAKYCVVCHNAKVTNGNLNLEALKDAGAALKDPNAWETVAQKLHAGVMPPPGMPGQRLKKSNGSIGGFRRCWSRKTAATRIPAALPPDG